MKDNYTTTTIILSIVLAIIIALVPYYLLIHFVVDPQSNNVELDRAKKIQTFYEQSHEGDIFFIGSSLVNEGIDGYLVEDLLQRNLINRSVYVLAESADTPLERASTLDGLIASRPAVVVIGLSFNFLTSSKSPLNEVSDRLHVKHLSEESKFLFNDEQLEQFDHTPLESFFDKRKYLISSIYKCIKPILIKGDKSNGTNILRSGYPDSYTSNFKDPWVRIMNKTEAEKVKEAKSVYIKIFEDSNQQTKALQYTVKKLRENNISVIIINMPISPKFSNIISESTRVNYSKHLNSTGVQWYDYEKEYPQEYFTDKWHLNVAGRNALSSRIATVLIDYFKEDS